MRSRRHTVTVIALAMVASGCSSDVTLEPRSTAAGKPVPVLGGAEPYQPPQARPPVTERQVTATARSRVVRDVYAATRPGMVNPGSRHLPGRVYVARGRGVDVVAADTRRVVGRLKTGRPVRRITPSWDLGRLWLSTKATLIPLDARFGRLGRPIRVGRSHVLRFTVDGRHALVIAGKTLQIRDPETMRARESVPLPCRAADGADLSADGSSLVVSCGKSSQLVRVNLARLTSPELDLVRPELSGGFRMNRVRRPSRLTGVTNSVRLARGAAPAEVRLSPDGTLFYVSDPRRGGVWAVDAFGLGVKAFIRTGPGAYGVVPGRYSDVLYVPGRGTIAVISFATRRVVTRWKLPASRARTGQAAVSADGRTLWLPGRTRRRTVVYALSTKNGALAGRVKSARGPSGGAVSPGDLCVHPQPGRFSVGTITRLSTE